MVFHVAKVVNFDTIYTPLMPRGCNFAYRGGVLFSEGGVIALKGVKSLKAASIQNVICLFRKS